MKTRTIPSRYVKVNRVFKTIYTRGKGGRFTGRRAVKGYGDATAVRYLSQDVDLDKDGRIENNEKGGTILGRTRSIQVKGSKRARAYQKQI